MSQSPSLKSSLREHPALAILRGVPADKAADIGRALVDSGWRAIEVPLNRPEALDAIAALTQSLPSHVCIGAGTVTTVKELEEIAGAGAQFAVSPHLDLELVAAANRLGLQYAPGVLTPSEWYAAWRGGASAIKLFPYDAIPRTAAAGMLTIAPPGLPTIAVGGISVSNVRDVLSLGFDAAGMASSLYRPGDTAEAVQDRAESITTTLRATAS